MTDYNALYQNLRDAAAPPIPTAAETPPAPVTSPSPAQEASPLIPAAPIGNDYNALYKQLRGETALPELPTPELEEAPSALGPERGIIPSFTGGLGQAARTYKALPSQLALAGKDVVGVEGGQDELTERVMSDLYDAGQHREQYVEFDEAFDNPSNFVNWLAFTLGEQVPNVAFVIGSGGLGGLLAKGVAKGAISRTVATAAGAYAGSSALETGATVGEQVGAIGEVDGKAAVAAGLIKGSLEAVLPLALGKTAGIFGDDFLRFANRAAEVKGNVISRGVKGFVKLGTVEGLTEAAQEVVDIAARIYVDETYKDRPEEWRDRIVESFVTGAFSGGAMGAATSAMFGTSRAPEGEDYGDTAAVTLVDPTEPSPALQPTPGEAGTTAPAPATPTSLPGLVRETPITPTPAPAERVSILDLAVEGSREEMQPFTSEEAAAIPGAQALYYVADKPTIQNEAAYMEFVPAAEAFTKSASLPGGNDALNQFVLQAKATSFEDTEVTAALTAIETTDELSTSARTTGTKSEEVIKLVERAQDLHKEGRPVAAQQVYTEALQKGFRYTPEEGKAIVAIGAPKDLVHRTGFYAPRNEPFSNTRESVPQHYVPRRPQSTQLPSVRVRSAAGVVTYPEGSLTHHYNLGTALVNHTPAPTGSVFEVQAGIDAGDIQVTLPKGMKNTPENVNQFVTDLATDVSETALYDAYDKGFRIRFKSEASNNLIQVGTARDFKKVYSQRNTSQLGPETINAVFDADNIHRHLDSKGQIPSSTILDSIRTEGFTVHSVSATPHRALTETLRQLHKKFLPDTNVTVILAPLGNYKGQIVTAYTDSSKSKLGYVIEISTLETREQQLATALHEFGHAIQFSYLDGQMNKGNLHIQELMSAFERWRYRSALKERYTDAAKEGYGFFRGLIVSHASNSAPRQAPTLEAKLGTTSLSRDYYMSFNEWMAEQFVQFAETKPIDTDKTRLVRIITALTNKLKKMYASLSPKLQQTVGFTDANSAFVSLLDHIRSNKGAYAQTEQSYYERLNTKDVWLKQMGTHVSKDAALPGVAHMLNNTRLSSALSAHQDGNGSLKQRVKDVAYEAGYFNSVVKWGWNVIQLAKKNPGIQFLQDYVSTADLWQNERSKWQLRANDTIRSWRTLGKTREETFAKFIFDLTAMPYLGKGEKPRMPTKTEIEGLIKKHKIDKGQWALYQRIRDDFLSILSRIEAEITKQAHKTLEPGSAVLAIELAKIKTEFKVLRNRPYFPYSRFGSHSVVVTDAEGSVVHLEHVELSNRGKIKHIRGKTPAEVTKLQRQLQKEYGAEYSVGVATIPDTMKPFASLPQGLLRLIREQLGSQLDDAAKTWLDKVALEYTPTQSFRRHFQKRKSTAGFSQDAMRAYADYFWHASNHIARITYGSEMQAIIGDFRKDNSQKLRGGFDITNRTRMVDFLENHLDAILNPGPDWAQLRSVAFIWWMGFSPAAAALNFTQLPLVTLPYLGTHFGDIKATRALVKAATELRKMYENPADLEKNWNPQDGLLLSIALQQNFVEESLATEIAGVAEGSNLIRSRHGTAIQRGLTGMAQASTWMFQGSEKINRRVTFTAAVRLARQNPGGKYLKELQRTRQVELTALIKEHGLDINEATAFLAGKDAVLSSQFEYAAHAKPRFMRGRKGVIFTFYMFLQNMLWTVSHGPSAKRTLIVMLGMAGMMGLPGAEDLEEVASYAGKKLLGKHFSLEQEIAKYLAELTDPETADVLLHGTGRVGFGLPALGDLVGVPLPSFDMSGSVGMGSVIPGLQEVLKAGSGDTFESTLGRAATDIAGASYGIGINMWKFLTDSQLPIDDAKRWERAVPRAMKNVLKALRYVPPDSEVARVTGNFIEAEGRERSRTGSTIIAFDGDDPEHMMEIAAQALGFAPTRLNRKWNRVIAQAEVVNYWKGRRAMLTAQFWHTLYTKDNEARADVLKAIKRYNKIVPFGEMGITGKELRTSVKSRNRNMALREADVALEKRYRRLHEEAGSHLPLE